MNQGEQWFGIRKRQRLRIVDFADKALLSECSSPVFIDKQFCGDRVHRQQCEGYSQSSNCERVS